MKLRIAYKVVNKNLAYCVFGRHTYGDPVCKISTIKQAVKRINKTDTDQGAKQ